MAFKELTVEEWKEQIDSGLSYRRRYGMEDKWAEIERLFYNRGEGQNIAAGPNILVSTGDSLLSTLSVPAPYLTIRARRMDYVKAARVVESVDNQLVDDMLMPIEVERACGAGYMWGRGFLKIGYDSETGWDDRFDVGGRKPVGMSQSQFDVKGRRIEFAKTRPGMPWVRAVMPHDIVVPWGVYDIEDAPWIAHRVVRHVDDIKADVKYNSRGLEGVMSTADFTRSYETVSKPYRVGRSERWPDLDSSDTEYCELWEIHDRRTGRVFVIATGHDKFLRNAVDVLQTEGLPFVGISFVPRIRHFWVTPDCFYLLAAQAELNDIAIMRRKNRRINIAKWIYGEDAFDESELAKLMSPNVGGGVRAKGGIDLSKAVVNLQQQYNPALAQEALEVRRDAREMVGMSRNQVGEFEGGRRTATEVNEVSQSSDLRMGRRTSGLALTYTLAFRKINQIIFDRWKGPRVAEVTDENGVQQWIRYNGPGLRGEYLYKVGFSPTGGNETLQQRQSQAMQWFMAMSQNPLVDPVGLARFIAGAMNNPEFSSVWKPGVLDGNPQMGQGGGGAIPQGQGAQGQGALGGQGQGGPQPLLTG